MSVHRQTRISEDTDARIAALAKVLKASDFGVPAMTHSAVMRLAITAGLPIVEQQARENGALAADRGRCEAAQKLEAWRRKAELGVAEAGAKIGLKKSAWRPYETGERVPKPDVRKKIEALTNGAVTAREWRS